MRPRRACLTSSSSPEMLRAESGCPAVGSHQLVEQQADNLRVFALRYFLSYSTIYGGVDLFMSQAPCPRSNRGIWSCPLIQR
jgi:hypothetical protein